uniref:alpha-L-rhamnosidase C-terminal domain-containing protein n=1 Tax=Saccharopolyspora rhizosphaerae TaxID=2492662 RepID=UPI001F25FAEB|nr:alpha-L-rhamnosidase C-terminal domain-containing protein [Saccharopolyspora rhizosphaerae]
MPSRTGCTAPSPASPRPPPGGGGSASHHDPGGGLTWARGAYDGPYGRVALDWSIEDDTFTVHTEVPANCTADLHLPDGTTRELRSGAATHTCPMPRESA